MIKKALKSLSLKRGRPIDNVAREKRMKMILDGARACFVMSGFHGASMSEISKRAKVSAANIYQYYSNKEELILALVENNLTAELEVISEITHSDLSYEELRKILTPLLTTEQGLMLSQIRIEILSEAARNKRVSDLVNKCDGNSFLAIVDSVKLLRETGRVSHEIDPERAAFEIAILFEGLLVRCVLHSEEREFCINYFAEEIHRILKISNKKA